MPEVALDARSRHRFKREFEIMRDLAEVPGVLRVYDFNESNCSYTMEAGETTLLEFMSNPLSEEIKMTIIEQIVSAMADIHSRGYIHRDLSPTNIFLWAAKDCRFRTRKKLEHNFLLPDHEHKQLRAVVLLFTRATRLSKRRR